MVQSQLRDRGIRDERVLAAMEHVPRHEFVAPKFYPQAYDDTPLPLEQGQTISQPYIVALMLEALQLEPQHAVLEIGTGSGYQTAVLATLCRRVFSIERHRGLLREAERRFEELRLRNIVCRFGDGTKGWPEQAPYDRVIVTAAAPQLPASLVDRLVPGGILIAPIGEDHRDQQLVRVRRDNDRFAAEDLGTVRFVPLVTGLPRRREGQNLT